MAVTPGDNWASEGMVRMAADEANTPIESETVHKRGIDSQKELCLKKTEQAPWRGSLQWNAVRSTGVLAELVERRESRRSRN